MSGSTPSDRQEFGDQAVLIPVKSFRSAKQRLGAAMNADDRKALAISMATHVVAAAAPFPVAVVCDDPEVASWARSEGALVIWEPGQGLNRAVEAGVERLGALGVATVIVAHADLPQATGLASIAGLQPVTLVPDRKEDGTNVIRLPVGIGFQFSYGPGSFSRHKAECDRLGLPYDVLRSPTLTLDVDFPADLVVDDAPQTGDGPTAVTTLPRA